RHVDISTRFPLAVQRFTVAHEVGHIFLHHPQGLHRDRPLDGGNSNTPRSRTEKEADRFAAYFLMPREIVEDIFEGIFGPYPGRVPMDLAFGLRPEFDRGRLLGPNRIREFSQLLASAEH